MSSVTRLRASSLVETVIAMFLLLVGFLVIFRLFQVSLHYNNQAQKRLVASRIATKKMAEIRAWARDPDNWDHRWSLDYDGTAAPDPDDSTFTVSVTHENHELLSPCTSLEERWVASGKERRMAASYRRVTVTVAWSAGSSDRLSITSLVGDPPRTLASDPLQISFPGGRTSPLAPDGVQRLEANLLQSNGEPVRDVCFDWYVVPSRTGTLQGGNGVIDTDLPATKRHGRRVGFRNMYPHPGGWIPIRGSVRVQAISHYRGALQTQLSQRWSNTE